MLRKIILGLIFCCVTTSVAYCPLDDEQKKSHWKWTAGGLALEYGSLAAYKILKKNGFHVSKTYVGSILLLTTGLGFFWAFTSSIPLIPETHSEELLTPVAIGSCLASFAPIVLYLYRNLYNPARMHTES